MKQVELKCDKCGITGKQIHPKVRPLHHMKRRQGELYKCGTFRRMIQTVAPTDKECA